MAENDEVAELYEEAESGSKKRLNYRLTTMILSAGWRDSIVKM